MQEDHPLQVARCTKIIQDEKDNDKSKYVINVKQIAKFVVKLGERVSPTDIEEGMRVGCDFPCGFPSKSSNILPVLIVTNMKSFFLSLRRSTPLSP